MDVGELHRFFSKYPRKPTIGILSRRIKLVALDPIVMIEVNDLGKLDHPCPVVKP